MESETVETKKVVAHCAPGDGGLCVNSDGTVAVPETAVEPPPAAVQPAVVDPVPVPVQVVEVSTTPSCASSCNSTSMSDGLSLGFALLVPLFIKALKRI